MRTSSILAIVFGFSFLVPALAQADSQKGIFVTGECNKYVLSDRGSIVLTADFVKPNITEASRETTQAYNQLKTKVEALGLDNLNLQTTEYSVQEVRDFVKNTTVFRGYRARMGLQASTSDIQRLGEVIQIASKLRIQDVGQLRTFLSEAKLKAERETCLHDAVLDARKKAEHLAEAAHVHVGKAEMISETGNGNSFPMATLNAKMLRQADTANIVTAPEQISVQVNVTYGID